MEKTQTQRNNGRYYWALLRLGLGWIFLWAFLDKTFGLGFATQASNAWIRGGSPTAGFLSFGTSGPFAPMFQAIAGNVVVDVLFMAALLLGGIALLTGVAVHIAGIGGAVLMGLMWLAATPPANNPLLDDHIIYAIALVAVAFVPEASSTWSLARWWRAQSFVRKHPLLA